MKHSYLNNKSVDEAQREYFELTDKIGFTCKAEEVLVNQAFGRVTAYAVYAKISSPHYNASAMDGICVAASSTYGASEENPVVLTKNMYETVDTGDAIPDGYDAVIMVEDLIENGGDSFVIHSAVHPWQNIRQVGEDICQGDMLVPAFTTLTPAMCGALLAGGVTRVGVVKKPLVGIIPTGDEIVEPCENPKSGEIIEFNSTVFSGMLLEKGASVKVYDIVRDEKPLLKSALKKAVSECDLVLISAGSSAGRDDYTSEIIEEAGTVLTHGIAIKPGKPAILGACGNTPVIGLPGYPVSAIVVMSQFVLPLIDMYFKRAVDTGEYVQATLGKRIVSSLKYAEYVRVTLGKIGDRLIATPLNKGAGIITSFTKADAILFINQNCEGIEQGTQVRVRLLKSINEIESSLVVTGSHDPLIDEIANILKMNATPVLIKSNHVGSMGAITALKSGLSHLGAIHLLDTQTGEYNTSYLEKYFDGEVTLVKGVKRVQGIMVKKGNPLNIRGIEDLKQARIVNRQRGSGTRILLDYLLKKHSILPDEISGYSNEEFTHTAVAALIKADNADAGLGIYSAAAMYGLDFIPVCCEEYDFVVDNRFINDEKVKAFFDVLKSDEFNKRINELGGYEVRE